jgi:glycosyltransferase involved in cell wall biosynthesis
MKLIIQIPCYNEENTLPTTLADLPQSLEGINSIEVLVVDDGSSDQTAAVAESLGVAHVVRLGKHQGLGAAFRAGLDAGLKRGADIIVNTDGDNQYRGSDVTALVAPILENKADLVVGVRNIDDITHFSKLKKWLQKIGSWVVRKAARSQIEDTTSGFRAFNREAALRMNVFSEFSYTLETLIQAAQTPLRIRTVPVQVNPQLRPSRLAESIGHYLLSSATTILRIYCTYNPRRVFFIGGSFSCLAGLAISLRYLYLYLSTAASGHVQSLILSAILMILGFQLLVVGVVSELISVNRRLSEDVLYRLRKLELGREPAGILLAAETISRRAVEMISTNRHRQP